MSDKLELAVSTITAAKTAAKIVEIPQIQDMWIQRYEAISGNKDGEMKFEREKLLFLKVFQNNPKLDNLDPFSKYTAFFDLCASGLTLADDISYIYSMDNKTVVHVPSWKGRLEQINQMPNIKFAYEPEVVYDCDEFKLTRKGPIKEIHHVSDPNRTPANKAVHVYMYLEFEDGRIVLYEMPAAEVHNIRNTRSKSYKSYLALLALPLNKDVKYGEQAQNTYQDRTYLVDLPMAITDEGQYFKKCLVRRTYGQLPKLPKQVKSDLSLQEKYEAAKEVFHAPERTLAPPEEVEDKADEQADEKFTDFEEVKDPDQKTTPSEDDDENGTF